MSPLNSGTRILDQRSVSALFGLISVTIPPFLPETAFPKCWAKPKTGDREPHPGGYPIWMQECPHKNKWLVQHRPQSDPCHQSGIPADQSPRTHQPPFDESRWRSSTDPPAFSVTHRPSVFSLDRLGTL